MTWIKICGLRRQEDAELAAALGANALGFVFEPTSPRCVGPLDWAPDWLTALTAEKVAVFGPVRAVDGLSPAFDTIQGVEWPISIDLGSRRRQPVLRVGSPVHATLPIVAKGAIRIVLDAPHPSAYGGTGLTVDWELAAEIVRTSPVTVVLAGGLNPDNVARAIEKVRPFGVDVSSGVESAPGIKDAAKLQAFFDAVRGA